ncbi:hypothetical protein [Agrococcus sp. DT81.2]|uniref:hypothetical protein n=1 Tax=Agrococcus sp. DT81.2 TaxID=3393414 RepID=UPI003CE473EB
MTARQHFPQMLTAARKAAAAGKHAEVTRLLAPITDTFPTAAAHPRARTPELPQALELVADLQFRAYPAAAAGSYEKAIAMWTLMALDLEAAGRMDNARAVRARIDHLSTKRVAAYRTGARNQAHLDRLISQDKRGPGLGSIGHA